MIITILIWSLTALVCYLVIDLYLLLRVNKSISHRGRPSIRQLLSHRNFDLKLISYGTPAVYEVERALLKGGKPALEALIRDRFGEKHFDEWSLDYCYPHIGYDGTKKTGHWSDNRDGEVTIYFYRKVVEAKPVQTEAPKSVPINLWTEADEKIRIELFLAGETAFWLNPDWSDPREPFWMRAPAPIPGCYETIDAHIRKAAHLLFRSKYDSILECYPIGQPGYAVYLQDPEGGEIRLTGREYRQAMRIASKMHLTDSA